MRFLLLFPSILLHWIDNNEHQIYQLVSITSIYFLACMRPNCAFCIFVGLVRTNAAFRPRAICQAFWRMTKMKHAFPNFAQVMTLYRINRILWFVHIYIRIQSSRVTMSTYNIVWVIRFSHQRNCKSNFGLSNGGESNRMEFIPWVVRQLTRPFYWLIAS